jgi:hypothetical protein
MMQRPTRRAQPDGLVALPGPELVIGLVGAVGCDLEGVSRLLTETLAAADYTAHIVRVSSLLHQLDKYQHLATAHASSEYSRISDHMSAGTELRSIAKRGDIMAWLSMSAIRGIRTDYDSSPAPASPHG